VTQEKTARLLQHSIPYTHTVPHISQHFFCFPDFELSCPQPSQVEVVIIFWLVWDVCHRCSKLEGQKRETKYREDTLIENCSLGTRPFTWRGRVWTCAYIWVVPK